MARSYAKTKNHTKTNLANRFYWTWIGMTRRCHDPKFHKYRLYGARGIAVCQEWQDSAAEFFAWAEATWREGCTLDRRDNDGDYSPENCRWATPVEQAGNSRQGCGASQYRGVQKGHRGRWKAVIYEKGKEHRIPGEFKTEIEAVRARDAKIAELGLPLTRQSGVDSENP